MPTAIYFIVLVILVIVAVVIYRSTRWSDPSTSTKEKQAETRLWAPPGTAAAERRPR